MSLVGYGQIHEGFSDVNVSAWTSIVLENLVNFSTHTAYLGLCKENSRLNFIRQFTLLALHSTVEPQFFQTSEIVDILHAHSYCIPINYCIL